MQVQLLDSPSWPTGGQQSTQDVTATATTTTATTTTATTIPSFTSATATAAATTTTTSDSAAAAAAAANRTDQLFTELQRVIENGEAGTPIRDHELLDFHTYPSLSLFAPARSGKMPPKKSGRAMLREEGGLMLRHARNGSSRRCARFHGRE